MSSTASVHHGLLSLVASPATREQGFRLLMQQYNKDMIAAWGDDEASTPAKTSAEAAERVKQRMERQQRAQSIRIAYTDRFATVLTPEQLQKFYRVESDIQRRLRQRKSAGRSPRSRR